jgi:hypothetical protein
LLYQDYFVTTLPFVLPIRIAYLGFFNFILGIFAAHHELRKFKLIFLASIPILAWYIFREGQAGNYYSQWRPSVLLYSACIAIFFYHLFTRIKLPKFTRTLSSLSFFVFFIHVIILEVVSKSLGPTNNLALFLLVTSISFTVAFLAHKIPYLSKLTG